MGRERAARSQPSTAFDGEVYRSISIRFTAAIADHSRSDPGRYNAPGQSAFYAAPSLDAVKVEARNYEAVNGPSASGLDGKSVVRGSFQGELLDLRATPGLDPSALTQPHGYQGGLRSTLARVTGEDAYTLPRALGDVARERGLSGVIAPANVHSTNIALFPDHPNQPTTGTGHFEAGYRPLDHTQFDADGPVVSGRLNQPHASVPDSKPNKFSPSGVDNEGVARGVSGYLTEVGKDTDIHTRAGGARYGAAGAALASVVEGVATGHLDGRKVAADTALGTVSGQAETALAHGIERAITASPVPPGVAGVTAGLEANTAARIAIRPPALIAGAGAAGVVGAVVGAGATAWQDADAVKHHAITAGQATADVAVEAGIGFGAGASGAAAGALAGSVVPVAGTAVGAVVGFGIGAGVGYVAQHSEAIHAAQQAAGDYLTQHYEKSLQHAWQGVAEGVDRVRSAPAAGLNAVENAASGAVASAEAAGRRVADLLSGTSNTHTQAEQTHTATARTLWERVAAAAPQAQSARPATEAAALPVAGQRSGASDAHPLAAAAPTPTDVARSIWRRIAATAPPAEPQAQQVQRQGVGLRR